MIQDIFFPSKLGYSYIFAKKVLSIEVTQFAVHGILLLYKGNRVFVKNNISVPLKDYSTDTVVTAIKKIISTIGSYNEVVTSLSGSSVIYKELTLPFIGREKLEMIVAYEVESLLPFALDQAVIDFIVTKENKEKNESTILVAAALKKEIDSQVSLFQKADVILHTVTVDMFALYELYKYGMQTKFISSKNDQNEQKNKASNILDQQFAPMQQNAEIFVDVGSDVTRVLYIVDGVLKGVRVVPYGVVDMVEYMSKKLEMSDYDLMQQLLDSGQQKAYTESIDQEFETLFNHLLKTIAFFEQQQKDEYVQPSYIIFSGFVSGLGSFLDQAQKYFQIQLKLIDMTLVTQNLHVKMAKKVSIEAIHSMNFAIGLFAKYNDTVNFLQTSAHRADNILFLKQLSSIIFLTVGCIGFVLYSSLSELQRLNTAYIVSKKDLVSTIDRTMGIDLKQEKNLKNIVKKADEVLKKEHKLWFSFSKKTEQSYLEYLQDLSVRIDKESIGLDLKKLTIEPDLVTMNGSVKDFESLEVFEEELSELELLQLVEKPRELSFTVQLKVKQRSQHDHY